MRKYAAKRALENPAACGWRSATASSGASQTMYWGENTLLVITSNKMMTAKNAIVLRGCHPPAKNRRNAQATAKTITARSEEHTSELQSRFDLVCRLLLEKKKKKNIPSSCSSN